MSRCFPYPPPGYVRNGARGGDSLIESIEREREKAKTEQRKEKKREKKEKRKERKEKEKNKIHEINGEKVKQLSDEKSPQGEKRKDDLIGGYLPKKREDDTEHLEKSGLTEEHEQPICSQNLCYLSDGTQSSKKRKMLSSPSNGGQNHGNIMRIRLSLRKHREPNVSLSEEQLCSTSGREEPLVQKKDVHKPRQEQCSLTPEPNKEVYCSDSWNKGIFAQNVAEAAFGTSLYEDKKMKRAESQYKALIEDWVPVPLLHQFERNDYDDQEWLFGTKQQKNQQRHECKRLKAANDVSSYANATLWPCAQYLPETDVYALPYTIPF